MGPSIFDKLSLLLNERNVFFDGFQIFIISEKQGFSNLVYSCASFFCMIVYEARMPDEYFFF